MLDSSTSTNKSYIDRYCTESWLHPRNGTEKMSTITSTTTMEGFVNFCSANAIKPLEKNSIDAIVAVAVAAIKGNLNFINQLVEKLGSDILNKFDKNRLTPLHIVCIESCVGTYNIPQLYAGAKRLIELGADPNIYELCSNFRGSTPLMTSALKAENLPLTVLLLENHAKINSSIFHITTNGIAAEPTVRINLHRAKKNIATKISVLLCTANEDFGSKLMIFPKEVLKIIALLFWHTFTAKEEVYRELFLDV